MSNQPMTPLDAAILRGRNLRSENPLIQSYSPPPQDMYRIILAAVLNLHDKVEELCRKLDNKPVMISYNEQTLSDDLSLEMQITDMTSSGPQLVSKPCASCGKMMENVFPTRKYCDECKGAKK